MRTSRLLIVLAFATSAFSFGACGGKTVGIAGLTGNGSGSGTGTSHGSGTGTGVGSGSGTRVGSGTGTSTGSGTGTSTGSGTGTSTGSGTGFGCAGPQPDNCPWCDGTVPAICTEMGWECPPPPPCVGPEDAGFGPDTGFPDTSFPDTSFPDAGFGTVACGAVSCSTSAFYCLEEVSGNQTTFSCADYPPPCAANPSCACLIANEGNCACSDDGNGGLLLTCAPLPP